MKKPPTPPRPRASRALVVAAVLAAGTACHARTPAYDNLLLVTVDTLRADHLGLYGYPRPTSPYLDELGSEGVVFWHAIASSSHTAPSHASILTSLYPEQHRVLVNGQELQPDVPSLADIARAGGRETAAFVSVRFLEGLRHGFDVLDADVPDGHVFRTADATVDRAVRWLRERDPSRPFLLWLHVYDPHQHVVTTRMPEPYYQAMREDSARRGDEFLYFLKQEQGYPRDAVSDSIDRYDAQVAFVDAQVRRLFEAAAEVASPGRTLRVVTADHGEGLGNHGFEGHGRYLYNEQLRAPLIIHGDPERLRHAVVPSVVRHVDVLPTVAELLGLELPGGGSRLEGRSLVPLFDAPSRDLGLPPAFSQRRPPDERRLDIGWEPGTKLAAQDARHKYIYNSEGDDEFYDIHLDPNELRNLAGSNSEDERRLHEWLTAKMDALSHDHRTKGETPGIDPRHLEDLRALGYIQDQEQDPAPDEPPDPEDDAISP